MAKYNLVLADSDLDYINSLMNYISQKYSHKLNVISFTDQEYLEDYINQNNKVDILLISSDFYSEDLSAKQNTVTILMEVGESSRNSEIPFIKKYQSADKICSEVVKVYESNIKEIGLEKLDSSMNTLTFFSPIGGIGKTTLALSVAYNLSQKNKKVVYINLEEIQSSSVFVKKNDSRYNLSDLIFSIKQRNDEVNEIINKGIVKDKETGIYLINSAQSILDIEELSGDDLTEIIERIQKSEFFEYLILDLPSSMKTKYSHIFNKSNKVFIPIGQDIKSVYMIDSLIGQLDEIDNFYFIQNKVKEGKRNLLPKVIISQVRPIVKNIHYYEELEEVNELEALKENCSDFVSEINELVINNILF